ncbi:hypothetical protein WIW50_13490 [Flavobacteriaceae bacterium 3-367]
MKTYHIWYALLALVLLGCSSSEDGSTTGTDDELGTGVPADYALLTSNNGNLSSVQLNANRLMVTHNPNNGPFGTIPEPSIFYLEDTRFSYFNRHPDCSGEIASYNFTTDTTERVTVFADLLDCQLVVKAVARSSDSFFIAYETLGPLPSDRNFYIRAIDIASSAHVDVPLSEEPLQLDFSGNRLFILTLDPDISSKKNALVAMDSETKELLHEVNLDLEVQKIKKDPDGNIVVSYPSLHLVISSTTMGVLSTVRYTEGTEPKFGFSERNFFDSSGNLYYQRPESTGEYPSIPAVYEFGSNTAILYFYENFLSEQQREFEFELGDTSMVSYDSGNNLILIGYRKSGSEGLGGLLRIKPAPDAQFVDNTDLEGIPFAVFIR